MVLEPLHPLLRRSTSIVGFDATGGGDAPASSFASAPPAEAGPPQPAEGLDLEERPFKKSRGDEGGENQVEAASATDLSHPLRKLMSELANGTTEPPIYDHGSWSGQWGLPPRSLFLSFALKPLGAGMSTLRHSKDEFEACLAQGKGGRKELQWGRMSEIDRRLFQAAAEKHWDVWLENQAVKLLSAEESRRVLAELERRGELDRTRFVMTDKNDGQRTEQNPLPVDPSARIVVPGFKDRANL
jgi:hypothetical protein